MNNFESLQTGSVRKKGSQWYYRFRIKDQDGNWKMHEFKGGQTKAETTFMLKQALEEYRQDGSIFYAGSLTVGQLADMWYNAEIENSNLTTNGKYGYKNVINNIHNNPFSQIKLKDLTIEDIQEYVDGLYFGVYDNEGNQIAKPYAKATMRKFFLVLNNMFKYAVYPKKLLRENLMQYVKKRKVAKDNSLFGNSNEAKVQTITHQEFLKIINYLSSVEDYCYLALPIQIAYHTGMRAGEVCGLTWDDIDFENQVLYVRRSMYYDKDLKTWELKVPKNGKPRAIDFGDSLAHILLIAKHEQQRNKKIYGDLYQNQFYHTNEIRGKSHCQIYTDYNESYIKNSTRFCHGIHVDDIDYNVSLSPLTFVCTKPDGELLTTQTLKWCNKVVQKNLPEISHFHFHCLRHTYASTLVLNGANIKDVQSLLGHSDIKITLNTYSHVTEKSRKKAVNIFENAISDKIG